MIIGGGDLFSGKFEMQIWTACLPPCPGPGQQAEAQVSTKSFRAE